MTLRRATGMLLAGATAAVSLIQTTPASASSGDAALAVFHHHLLGASLFTQDASGAIRVRGGYLKLRPGKSYFTVIYGNGNCDPAQAFPVGPFTADRHGRASIDMVVPSTVDVGGTMSMSVRKADTQADLDGDGKVGPTDVVAVPGQPSIGLIECDYHPVVRDEQ